MPHPTSVAVDLESAPVRVIAASGTVVVRVYDSHFYRDGAAFRYLGPHIRGRWDHHLADPTTGAPVPNGQRGVLYATLTLRCAVAEVFGDDRRLSPSASQRLAVLEVERPLELIDTCGLAAMRLGVAAGALRARDRALTQRLSRELYETTGADGLIYEGWQTGEACLCLWERAEPAITVLDDRGLIDDPDVALDLAVIADELGYDRPVW
jgi:RES domain